MEIVDALMTGLEASGAAAWVKSSRWIYAGVNAAHILSIALLVGAILPMDGRLLGLWPRIALPDLARVLVPVAGLGLAAALVTGPLLLSVRATRYAAMEIVQAKLAIVALGAALAILLHLRAGLWLDRVTPGTARLHGALSLFCWLGALVCGRLIAYA